MKRVTMILFACMTLMMLTMCNKQKMTDSSRVAVRLKDAPADWDKVNIDIRGVQLQTDRGQWISVPVNSQLVDILRFRDTSLLLGATVVPAGTITSVKLELGDRNTLVSHGLLFNISIQIEHLDDLIVPVRTVITPGGTYVIMLDLDAAQSIFEEGIGQFFLRPHITISTRHHDGDNDDWDDDHDGVGDDGHDD